MCGGSWGSRGRGVLKPERCTRAGGSRTHAAVLPRTRRMGGMTTRSWQKAQAEFGQIRTMKPMTRISAAETLAAHAQSIALPILGDDTAEAAEHGSVA